MSYGIAAWTRLVGAAQGTFLDDLTDSNVGQWPKDLAIRRITNILVFYGQIVDGIHITYETTSGLQVVVQHGAPNGPESTNIALAEDQKLVAVYGRRLNEASEYGEKNIVQLTFMIAKDGSGNRNQAEVSIHHVDGTYVSRSNSRFNFTWPLVGVTSYSDQPSNMTEPFLQALGFSEVFVKADEPF